MQILSHTKSLVFILVFTICSSSYAQEGTQVNISFRAFSVGGDIKNLSCVTQRGSIDIKVPSKARSKVQRYRGSNTMVFFRKSEQVEGESIVPFASVKLKERMQAPLLIFIKTRSREGKGASYRIQVIEDHPKHFQNGTMKFVNLTQRTLYLIVGQKDELKTTMKPNQIVSHKLSKGFKGNLPLKIGVKTKKSAMPVMSSRVFPNKDVRDIYFIWPLPGKEAGNRVRIATLRERGDNARMRLRPAKQEQP